MKTIKIIKGFLLLFYHLLAPIAFWGIIATFIWGPEVLNTPRKGEPDMIFFLVFVPPAMLISAWHYVFNDFVPNVLVLMPKGKKEDPQSIEMMRSWIQKSKLIAKTKLDALEQYETKLAEQIK